MEHIEYLQEGAVVDQRYEIVSTISCADSRAVYLCKLSGGNHVAMKVMHRPRVGEDLAVTAKRFRNELVAAYQISHPNVVHVYEFIQHDDFLAYTMEYVSGGNLEDYLAANQVLRPEKTRKFLSQISSGLHAIHQAGIIHRELKPRNILISDEGDAKITDFGVAKVENQMNLTMHGGLVGTMDYLSPEYITEGNLTKSLDVYSVGVIGYQMLTGMVPFKSDDVMTMLTARLSKQPQSLVEILPNCPQELNDIIMKALSVKAEDRFSSALDMHLALDSIGTLDRVAPLSSKEISTSKEASVLSFEESRNNSNVTFKELHNNTSFSNQSLSAKQQEQVNVEQESSIEEKRLEVIEDSSKQKNAEQESNQQEDLLPSFEQLAASREKAELAQDNKLNSEEFNDDLNDFDDLELEKDYLDSVIFEQESPTASELHRAVDRNSRSKISHPIFLMSVVFFVAVAAGAIVSSGVSFKKSPLDVMALTNKIPFLGSKKSEKLAIKEVKKDSFKTSKKQISFKSKKKIKQVKIAKKNFKQVNKVLSSAQVEDKMNKANDDQEQNTLNEYKLLLGLNPTDPKVNYNLGLLYVGRGEYKTAEKYLLEAVRLDPDNSTAAYYLKRVKQKLKK